MLSTRFIVFMFLVLPSTKLPTYILKGKSLIGFHFHNCCVYLCCRLPYIIKPRENNDEASNRVPNWSLLRDGPHTIFIGGDSSRTTYLLPVEDFHIIFWSWACQNVALNIFG